MADLMRNDIVVVDLDKPLMRSSAGKVLAAGDNMANRFGAEVQKNAHGVSLIGWSCSGYFIRPDQETLVLDGVISGNTAYVDLPSACYTQDGKFTLAIRITNQMAAVTLRVVDGWICKTFNAELSTPDDGVISLEELFARIDETIEAANRAEKSAKAAERSAIKAAQQNPNFANSVEECTDPEKLYVLPDGYIYAYMKSGGYTNQVPLSTDSNGAVFNGTGYQDGYCLAHGTSGATLTQLAGHTVTGFIPMVHTDVIRMAGVTWGATNKNAIMFYDENKKPLGGYIGNGYVTYGYAEHTTEGVAVQVLTGKENQSVTTENGVTTFNLQFNSTTSGIMRPGTYVKYVRISAEGSGADMVVTLNEEITENADGNYNWVNTGHAFVPADYEDRIVELEKAVKGFDSMVTFKGKKVMFFGDSITHDETMYVANLLESTGMERVANFALNGARLANYSDTQMNGTPVEGDSHDNTVPNQVLKLLNSVSIYDVPDIVIVSAATNGGHSEEGYDESQYTDSNDAYISLDAVDLTKFSGAMRWIYEKLISCYPNTKVFFATPIQSALGGARRYSVLSTKSECIRQNCERLSTPCIDAFRKSGIYGRYEVSSANGKYLKDGLHPNADGAIVLAKCYHRELANALID